MEKEIKTEVLYTPKNLIYLLAFIFGGFFLSVCLIELIEPPTPIRIFIIVIAVSIVIIPLLFIKKVNRLFTNPVLINLNNSSVTINIFHKSGEIKKQYNYKWTEIRSYRISFRDDKYTELKIYKTNGKSKNWVLIEHKTLEEAIKTESILKTFNSFVKDINEKTVNENIYWNIGFLNSKTGIIVLYSLTIFFLIEIAIHIILSPESSYASLIVAISFIIQLWIQRNNEKKLDKEIVNL
ncbi:MAG: hypothetical protein JXQ69_04695 [Paludibacteraceae bacterium]|nr:hypothetical protein [Paludibacteraceae bacterium]MBN2787606.1 hypothetical protein [Paludibacteraceae bacterium]